MFRVRVPFGKRNILIRDNFTCQYCGKKVKKLTIDHIIPKSRGGETSFENCVSSCKECNNRKGMKTPREAGMSLMKVPTQPTIMEFYMQQMKSMGIDKLLMSLGVY